MIVFKDFNCSKCRKEFSLYAIVARRLLKHSKHIKGFCPHCGAKLYFTSCDNDIILDDSYTPDTILIPFCETARS